MSPASPSATFVPGGVLTEPATTDPMWREKIAAARSARELGARMRANKVMTFRRAVGQPR